MMSIQSGCVRDFLLRLISGEEAVSAIEYALLGALIAVAIAVGANVLGQNLKRRCRLYSGAQYRRPVHALTKCGALT